MIAPLMFTGPDPWMSTVAPLSVSEALASCPVADLVVVLGAHDEPAARERFLRPGHRLGEIGDAAIVGVVAGSFTGEPRVQRVVDLVAPFGVEAVTTGVGGRDSDRRGGRILGDEPEGTTDVCGERIRFGRQVREEVMV